MECSDLPASLGKSANGYLVSVNEDDCGTLCRHARITMHHRCGKFGLEMFYMPPRRWFG